MRKWQHYLNLYETPGFLPDHVESLLEIGVESGASLHYWRNRFPNAFILGCDVDRRCQSLPFPIIIGDVISPNVAGTLARMGPYQVIIDDGGHRPYQIYLAWKRLFPCCRGLYIIEDTHMSSKFRWRMWEAFRLPGIQTILRELHKTMSPYEEERPHQSWPAKVEIHPQLIAIRRGGVLVSMCSTNSSRFSVRPGQNQYYYHQSV